MFKSSMREVKEPTHYSKRVGHEVPGVVAVLCECIGEFGLGNLPSKGPCVLLPSGEFRK